MYERSLRAVRIRRPFGKSSEVEYNVLEYLIIFGKLCEMTCVQKLENWRRTQERDEGKDSRVV